MDEFSQVFEVYLGVCIEIKFLHHFFNFFLCDAPSVPLECFQEGLLSQVSLPIVVEEMEEILHVCIGEMFRSKSPHKKL